MKEFTFPAYCNYGKGDSRDSWIDVELTDEEAELLLKYGTQSDIFYNDFYKCKELKELYNKIYSLAIKQMTEEVREFGDSDDGYANDPNWKIDDTYLCSVNFPTEFEDMLIDEEEEESVNSHNPVKFTEVDETEKRFLIV